MPRQDAKYYIVINNQNNEIEVMPELFNVIDINSYVVVKEIVGSLNIKYYESIIKTKIE